MAFILYCLREAGELSTFIFKRDPSKPKWSFIHRLMLNKEKQYLVVNTVVSNAADASSTAGFCQRFHHLLTTESWNKILNTLIIRNDWKNLAEIAKFAPVNFICQEKYSSGQSIIALAFAEKNVDLLRNMLSRVESESPSTTLMTELDGYIQKLQAQPPMLESSSSFFARESKSSPSVKLEHQTSSSSSIASEPVSKNSRFFQFLKEIGNSLDNPIDLAGDDEDPYREDARKASLS